MLRLLQSRETLLEAFTNFHSNVWIIKLGVFLEHSKICQNQNHWQDWQGGTITNLCTIAEDWIHHGSGSWCVSECVCVSSLAYVRSHAKAPACENTGATCLDNNKEKQVNLKWKCAAWSNGSVYLWVFCSCVCIYIFINRYKYAGLPQLPKVTDGRNWRNHKWFNGPSTVWQ